MLIDKKSPDLWLFVTVIILLAIGISMVFSSSYIMAYKWYGDSYYFLKRQLIYAIIALAAFFFATYTDYHNYKKIYSACINFFYRIPIDGVCSRNRKSCRWCE